MSNYEREDRQVIPTEAARAAVRAAKESFGGDAPRGMRAAIHAALEAAAPHMLADAFEAAADELDGKRLLTKPFHEYYPEWLRTRANELKTTNPYRSQA